MAGGLHPIERPCPKCGVGPGRRCIGRSERDRKAFHRDRGSRRGERYAFPEHSEWTKPESPIEKLLIGAILGWIDHHEVEGVALGTQVPVGPYRADIVITDVSGNKLAVECDGAAFHNSKEAVERDKRRDRYFLVNGVPVMRFSGAEISRDCRGCAAEVGLWIRRK